MSEYIGIIELRSKCVKRLDAVQIALNPTGVTLIEGPNAQGKSSVLDSLLYAVLGKGAVAEKPIKNGKDEAVVELVLSNGKKIKRTFKRKGEDEFTTAIELIGADGAKFGRPQETINDWLGSDIAFDPLDFAYMDGKRRREVLAQLVGIDLDSYAQRRKAVYDKRQAHYGLWDAAKRRLDGMKKPAKVEGDLLDVAALNDELKSALETLAAHSAAAGRHLDADKYYQRKMDEQAQAEAQLRALEARLIELQQEVRAAAEEAGRLAAERDAIVTPDVATIQAKLANADGHNTALRDAQRAAGEYEAAASDWEQRNSERDAYTAEIDGIDAERAAALSAAQYPVDGLSFGEDDVELNGLPFEQASTAEKIKVGMGVAIALNPKLRVIVSHDGSLLDKGNLALINDLAQQHQFQVILERVADEPGAGIFIVDGAVANG